MLGASDYRIGSTDGGVGGGGQDSGADCNNPSGNGGKGCYACDPTSKAQILNSCTGNACEPFDIARVPLEGGKLRPLPSSPANDAGVTPVGDAGADPPCSAQPNVVYATGSSAVVPFLSRIAATLAGSSPPTTVVYQSANSCAGVDAILDPTTAAMRGTAIRWDPAAPDPSQPSAQIKCSLDAAGTPADLGFSDVFAETCRSLPQGLPTDIRDRFGPVQTMVFVTPRTAVEKSLSGEAAYSIFGFGADSRVEPWNDPNLMFQRNAASGTQAMIAAVIGVPPDRWFGRVNASSIDVRNALLAADADSATAKRAIGILAADLADQSRDRLRVLAYQDFGQSCGFFPDSSPTALDKANVRDGRYAIWGPLHILLRVNGQGLPIKPLAQNIAEYIGGSRPLERSDLFTLYAKSSVVPQCAMHVTRTGDGGDTKRAAPAVSCNCYFDLQATGATSCKKCDSSTECPAEAPKCNKFGVPAVGYCEP